MISLYGQNLFKKLKLPERTIFEKKRQRNKFQITQLALFLFLTSNLSP